MKQLPVFEGPYRINKERSCGPIATTFEAVSVEHDRVLIRILNPRLAVRSSIREQFQSAVDLLSRLNHPNIGRILDSGLSRETPYYVTYDYPTSLRDRLAQGAMPQSEAIRIGRAVAEGLHHAHAQRFIQRDVRPETILFDRQGTPVLCEFGLDAEPEQSARTMIGTFLGIPAYMAPEQIAGISNPASDSYSLGIVLYEMLVGRPPFQDSDPVKLCDLQAHQPAPRLDSILPGAPEGLVRLIACLLEKEPGKRVADMSELIELLGQLGEPQDVREPSLTSDADDAAEVTIATPRAGHRATPPPATPPPLPPKPMPLPSPPPQKPGRSPIRPHHRSREAGDSLPIRDSHKLREEGLKIIPFWAWVLLAVLLTVFVTLAILRPWERSRTPEERSIDRNQMINKQVPPDPEPVLEETLGTTEQVEESTPVEIESEPETPDPHRAETNTPREHHPAREAGTNRKPPTEYDWTAKPAVLLVSATTEQNRQIAASIHLDRSSPR